jgi:ankyrin repeat protein
VNTAGVDVTTATASAKGWLPVHVVGLQGDVSGLTVLQGLGADVNAKTLGAGWRPFHYAAASRSIPTVQWLLKQGADVNAATSGSETALHFAARVGSLEMVDFLIEQGADMHAKRKQDGATTAHYAASARTSARKQIFQRFLEHGSDSQTLRTDNRQRPADFADFACFYIVCNLRSMILAN